MEKDEEEIMMKERGKIGQYSFILYILLGNFDQYFKIL